MPGEFDFFSDDPQPQPKTTRRPRDDDRDDGPPRRDDRRATRDDDRAKDERRAPKKGTPALLIALVAGGAILVVGLAVTIFFVVRGASKAPETTDRGSTSAAVSPPRSSTPVPPKGEPIDPNSPTKEVVEKVKKATVRVLVNFKNGGGGSGSGFVEKDSRLVLTNAHVVGLKGKKEGGPKRIGLFVNSGEGDKEYMLGGELVAADPDTDLAIIRPYIIEVGERHIVPEGLVVPKASNLNLLQKLFVFGFPLGDQLGAEISVRPTQVTKLRNESGKLKEIQVEGGMTFGNSGGPVVDVKGNVVGVAVAGVKDTNINLAIPGELVQEFLAREKKRKSD
ncbi:MAG TPA: serine protease [Gemmataceae bacterium]|nr:serine protease [Gemmataceae bacterium]